jgi:hypothetical protein
MSRTATVFFDGTVFRPEKPLEIEPNRRYLITVEEVPTAEKTEDAWSVLEQLAGTVEAPVDWAAQHDHYINGTPKYGPGTER